MEHMEIRNAEKGDEEILAWVQTESWKAAFSGILPENELEKATCFVKVKEMYRKILGEGIVKIKIGFIEEIPHCIAGWRQNYNQKGAQTAELICIHSMQTHWGQGFGSQMIKEILQNMKEEGYAEVMLWVFGENSRARRFYEKHGFHQNQTSKVIHGITEMMYSRTL